MSPSNATSFPLEEMGEAIADDAQVTHSLLDPASLLTTDAQSCSSTTTREEQSTREVKCLSFPAKK